MLHLPSNGQKVFEVAIYNKVVRALVKENQSHTFFEDHWADVQLQDVHAKDEDEARDLVAERFPPADGFVIDHLNPTNFEIFIADPV
ncbi:MAG: hypothetical protein ISR52_09125 [Rhodospirillales bacterium]|nr:hypothetical protein [Rhodospirillales bacterium]